MKKLVETVKKNKRRYRKTQKLWLNCADFLDLILLI